jgi:hypothetical protein
MLDLHQGGVDVKDLPLRRSSVEPHGYAVKQAAVSLFTRFEYLLCPHPLGDVARGLDDSLKSAVRPPQRRGNNLDDSPLSVGLVVFVHHRDRLARLAYLCQRARVLCPVARGLTLVGNLMA